MKNNQKHNRAIIRRVPLATIVKAKNGDNTALEKILRHYQGYMLKLSQFELYDASGTVYTCFDEELYQELQFKLVKAILDRFELR